MYFSQHLCIRFSLLLALSLALIVMSVDRAESWPADSEWSVLLKDGEAILDSNTDKKGSRGIVSSQDPDHDYGAAYIANDGTDIFFRLRLDADPRASGGGYDSFGWGFEFDTDNNLSDYEFLIMLNGIGTEPNETITIEENTVKTGVGDPSDQCEVIHATYSPATSYSRVVMADTSFNDDQDYFLDFAISYSDFQTYTGLSDGSPMRVYAGSSSSAHALTPNGADLLGAGTLADSSDPTNPYGNTPTTGTVRFVESDYSTDETIISAGDTIYIRVDDADMSLDPNAQDTITVVLTSALTGDTETVTLTETGNDTGIFTASISSELAAVSSEDGTMQVAYGDVITVTYNDEGDANGNANQERTDILDIDDPTLVVLSTFTANASANVVSVIWSTTAEIDSAGFNVWRSETAEDGYVKLNEAIIHTQGGENIGASYSYTDSAATPGVTYYYRLEDVDLSGVKTLHGPVSVVSNSQITVSLSAGINLISVPLNPGKLWTLSDLADAVGRDNLESIIYLRNGVFAAHEPDLADDSVNVPVAGDEAYIAVMRSSASVTFTGQAWDGQVSLSEGLDTMAVPVNPGSWTLSDLASYIGPSLSSIIWYDTSAARFVAYCPTADDMLISGGQGFIVSMTAPAVVSFEGTAWMDAAMAAPPVPVAVRSVDEVLSRLSQSLTPIESALLANYPNPFNPETWIPYKLSEAADVTVRIYSAKGELVRVLALGSKAAGSYVDRSKAAYWDGRNSSGEEAASGIYFYSIRAGKFSAARRMILIR